MSILGPPGSLIFAVGSTAFSLNAASATDTLTVEQGWNPEESATFWFTMVKMRPVVGSPATTDPLKSPSASTAALRTSRSSPSILSPCVESAYVGSVQGPPRTNGVGVSILGATTGVTAVVTTLGAIAAAGRTAVRYATGTTCAAAGLAVWWTTCFLRLGVWLVVSLVALNTTNERNKRETANRENRSIESMDT